MCIPMKMTTLHLLILLSCVVMVTGLDDDWLNEDNNVLGGVMEEEEVQEVLRKYDIDDDGQLSKGELELGQMEIQNIIKHKLEKIKDKAQEQTTTKKTEDGSSNGEETHYVLVALIVGGVVTVVALLAVNRPRTSYTVSPHTERQMQQRKEEFLAKISNQNQAKQEKTEATARGKAHRETQPSGHGDQRVDNSLFEIPPKVKVKNVPAESVRREKTADETLDFADNKKKKDYELAEVQKQLSEKKISKTEASTSPEVKSVEQDHQNQNEPSKKEQLSNVSKPTQQVSKKEKFDKRPETQEPTSDKDMLIQFLSQVLGCTLTVSDSSKTRYTLGNVTLHTRDVPETESDVPVCMARLLNHIVPRQISRIKYAVCCYSLCEEFEGSYQIGLVQRTADWLKDYCVNVIRTNLMKEFNKSDDGDLWSDYDTKHIASESVTFLWRVAGWAEDGVSVSPTLLTKLLQCEGHSDKEEEDNSAVAFLTLLLQAAGQQLSNVKRMDEVILAEGRTLRSLEILLDNAVAGAVMAFALQKEVREASKSLGNYYEKESLFGPLLSVSTVPTKFLQKKQLVLTGNSVSPFTSIRGFPRVGEDDVRRVEGSIQEGLHRCQNIVYSALRKVVTSKMSREQGLTWIASVIGLNELRTSALLQNDTQVQACCSDAYMLNFCGMLLEFFLPIHNDVDKLAKIDLLYSTSEACRLNYHFETCLAGGQIVNDKSQEESFGPLPGELQSKHSFITECFHLCQRALSVGVMPTVVHYNRMQRDFMMKIQSLKGSPQEEQLRNQHVLLMLMWDTCLCDEVLVRNTTIFYLSQARLLLNLLQHSGQDEENEEKTRTERKIFSQIPEFCVKDMAVWFRFVATHAVYIHKGVLQGLPISEFVDCCVALLERPDLMPGPIPASKMVSCLLQFVNSSRNTNQRGWGSGVMSDLAVMVETCPSVKNQLGPALLHTFISVDVVEGLDVDKDEFDKYGARSEIGKLIEHLWKRADCRKSIIEKCGTELFQNFLGAILDTLLYMLHDSLSRLANIKKIQNAKQNEAEWNALTTKEKMDRDQFLRTEEHVAKGFMDAANQTLDFIDLLTKAEEVARCFTRQPLARRSASVICGFLDSLCGSRAKDFKVKDFEKYSFNPQKLLHKITSSLLRIAREVTTSNGGFLVSMATDPDFDSSNLEKAHSVISSKGLAEEDTLTELNGLIHQLKLLCEAKGTDKTEEVATDMDVMEELQTVRVERERVVDVYTRCMSGSRFLSAEIQDSHSFHSNFQSLDPRSPKVKALMKEMKQLQQNLPIHPDASICVVQDEERIDVMRAMLTGPVGTPYSLGCFVFDIYFPASYPNSAPLVKIITTGGGTVRFNPNLYSDGKVCLSLLGTWHGGDASEKWNPGKSSIYQVLVSIQSLILIPEPMFNEPGYEGRKGTSEGDRQSFAYNWKIRLNTLRHAILGQLRNPPAGMEGVIRQHLALQRESVLVQCREWLKECQDEDEHKRMRQVVAAILVELRGLQVSGEKKEGEKEEEEED